MRVIKDIFVSLIILVGLTFFSVIASFCTGLIIEGLLTASPPTSWELLDSPVKFTEIIDLNLVAIWAQGRDDKLYYWENCHGQGDPCSQWIETQNIPKRLHGNQEPPVKKVGICPQKDNFPNEEPPGKIVECAFVYLRKGMGFSGTY